MKLKILCQREKERVRLPTLSFSLCVAYMCTYSSYPFLLFYSCSSLALGIRTWRC